jgi:hypothetical protein
MLRYILVVWVIAFLASTATTCDKLNPKILGAILLATAVYPFWIPAWILVTGNAIP